MSTIKRLRAPLIVMSGALLSVVAFAGPANAAYTSPIVAPQVLGTSVTAVVPAAAAVVPAAAAVATAEVAAETSGLAFTGTNAIGIGALGGLLLVGGVTMVVVGKRRKVNS